MPPDYLLEFRDYFALSCARVAFRSFAPEDVTQIRKYELDFVLRFAFGIIRGDILQSARYGVWSFHHGDELRYRGGPPCFWEIYRGDPVSAAILQRLTDRLDGGIVLRKGFLRTIDYSYARTIDQLYFESSNWPAYVASEIRSGIPTSVDGQLSVTDAPVLSLPRNGRRWNFCFGSQPMPCDIFLSAGGAKSGMSASRVCPLTGFWPE